MVSPIDFDSNEIKTVLTFGKTSYHERFHRLFGSYIDSFLPLTHLLAVSGIKSFSFMLKTSNLILISS